MPDALTASRSERLCTADAREHAELKGLSWSYMLKLVNGRAGIRPESPPDTSSFLRTLGPIAPLEHIWAKSFCRALEPKDSRLTSPGFSSHAFLVQSLSHWELGLVIEK